MIARLSYVMCDRCGEPVQPADDASEARALARQVGFVRVDGLDLCKDCKPADPESQEGER